MPHQRSKTKIQGTGGDKYKQSLLRNTWHSLYLSGWTNCIYPADKLYLSRNLTAPSIEKASTSAAAQRPHPELDFVLVHKHLELDRPVDDLIVDWPLEGQGGADPRDLGRGVYSTDDLMRR